MKLIVVRHGETQGNKNKVVMGHAMFGLNVAGKKQARLLGERLKNEKIDFIYSSDLRRTKETVQEIIKYHRDTPVVYDQRLRERDVGVLQGLKVEEFLKAEKLSGQSKHEFKPEKGESFIEVYARVIKFIDYLYATHKDTETVLLCTHGGWKRSFLAFAKGKEIGEQQMITYTFHNTSVTVFEIHPDKKPKEILINSTEHLG